MNLAVGKCPWLLIDITVPSAVLGVAVDDVSWHFQFYGSLQISGFIEAKRNGVKTIKAFPLRPLKSVQARAPGYVLRFNVAGIPYQEPSFSRIRRRQKSEDDPDVVGIAYLLTGTEYERFFRSEGGRGGSYLEIDVSVTPLLDLTNEDKEPIQCKSLQTRNPREHPHPFPSNRYITLIRTGRQST